ncbi:membrane protein insertase YidC [Halalkalibacterium ligniniphilum]|uniref:membrane protein insertase YidC n=1 Tax=Halalkalibacterium ligniniphilum TaxID=1134413 RepID=UPI00034B9CCB|nr:membrane protein insertase YidC [Halalkalibacterium ligniniphilum]
MKKRWMLLMIVVLIIVLTGCGTNQPITAETEGFWNHFFVYPMSWLIIFVANLFNGSYGLSIILVTILIRTALLPLTLKQQKSTRAMQALRPEMEELQKKFKATSKEKDIKAQQEMQKELMALYQKHGVNPLAGCLPIFVQIPILMAFYFAIMRTEEIAQHTFLWFDLGQPDYILPFIAGLTTYFQVKMSMSQTPSLGDGKMAEVMATQMKLMMYMMPVMIIIAGITLPSALSLYWVIGNIYMIIQTYFIVVKAPPLEMNKEKTTKKPEKA